MIIGDHVYRARWDEGGWFEIVGLSPAKVTLAAITELDLELDGVVFGDLLVLNRRDLSDEVSEDRALILSEPQTPRTINTAWKVIRVYRKVILGHRPSHELALVKAVVE